MIFLQKYGPFTNPLIFAPTSEIKLKFLQIGIEHPESIPISEFEDNNYPIIFTIKSVDRSDVNGQEVEESYLITERDILEFSNLNLDHFSLSFTDPTNKYLIVNVAYEEAD